MTRSADHVLTPDRPANPDLGLDRPGRVRRRTLARAAACVVVATGAALAPLGVLPAGAADPASGKVTVEVGDNYFKPIDLEVTAGTKVTWVNKGKILHTIKPDKGRAFGTSSLPRNKKYKFTFKKAGKFPYYCTLHGAPGSGQHGTITVVEATSSPTGATTSTTAAK